MEKSVVLGIDIGGTNTIYGYITRDGTIIFHDEIPTNGAKPISDLIGRISDNVKEFFSKNQGYSLNGIGIGCLLYTSPSPRDATLSRMPSSA